jgi:hypothetical protein
MTTKYIHYIHFIHPFLMSTLPHPLKIPIDDLRGFCLGTSGLYVSCFSEVNCPHYLLIFYHLAPLTTYSTHIILHSYIDQLFQYFSFANIFFPSTTSCIPFKQTH